MKKISKIISTALLVGIIPLAIVNGQDKKSEQKIKIIVDDGESSENSSMNWTVKEGKGDEEKVIIIKDGKISEDESGDSFTYKVRTKDPQNMKSESEKTEYVITKNGMRITIEGDDYAKVKKLADEIGKKMDTKDDQTEKKAVKKE